MGWVWIGDTAYPNRWVPEGTAIRQACSLCRDTGTRLVNIQVASGWAQVFDLCRCRTRTVS